MAGATGADAEVDLGVGLVAASVVELGGGEADEHQGGNNFEEAHVGSRTSGKMVGSGLLVHEIGRDIYMKAEIVVTLYTPWPALCNCPAFLQKQRTSHSFLMKKRSPIVSVLLENN